MRVSLLLSTVATSALVATGAGAQTFTVSTAETTPFNPASLAFPSGTINVTSTGSIITEFGGNHAIQPYVAGGTNGRWDVNVDGLVRSSVAGGSTIYAIWLRNGGDISVGTTGVVESTDTAIMVDAAGTSNVVNDGRIAAPSVAVSLQGGGSVLNNGYILGGVVSASTGVAGSIVNSASGTIETTGSFGLHLNAGGVLDNAGTVNVTNSVTGLWSHASTTFTNSGTFRSLGGTYGGQVSAALFQTGNIVASNTGTIYGRDLGLFGYQNGTFSLTNSGSITAETLDAVIVRLATGDVDITQTGGQILAGRNGIAVREGQASTVDISGGLIEAGRANAAGVGILFNANAGPAVLRIANATVSAPVTAIQAIGTQIDATLFAGSVINGAISFDAFDDKLTIHAGAAVNGAIDGGGGVDELTLTGSGAGFLGSVANFESLRVTGGRWTLNGTYAFSGGVEVVSGSIAANGSLGAPVTVSAGATLGGSGTVGTTTIASGGTLAPGNSIGTLTVAGDLTFEPGSHFAVEVDPAGSASDQVVVSGTATIDGGTVAHIGYVGNYRPFATYRILTAGTGLSGAFDAVTTDFAFLTPDLVYDYGAYTIDLTLARNTVGFVDKATTRNQIATAGGAESLGAGQAVYDAVAGLPDDAALIGAAFDSLSGEVHASARTVLVEDSRLVRQAANERLRAALAGAGLPALPVMAYAGGAPVAAAPMGADLALWGQGFGSWGHSDGDGNAAKLTRSLGGFLLGADAALAGNLRLGVLGGYSRSSFDVSGRSSSGSADNYHLGLYGGGAWALGAGELGLRAGLAYSWHDIDTRRQVSVGSLLDRPQADYGAGTLQAFGEMGYRFALGQASLEPFAGLAYVGLDTDAFAEAGDFGTAGAALTGAGRSTQTGFATLGLRAAGEVDLGTARLTLTGTLGWRHAFGDVAALSTNAFAGGVPFTVAGTAIARDAALFEAALALHLSDSARLSVAYEGQIADTAQDHGFSARLSARF